MKSFYEQKDKKGFPSFFPQLDFFSNNWTMSHLYPFGTPISCNKYITNKEPSMRYSNTDQLEIESKKIHPKNSDVLLSRNQSKQ